MRPEERYFKFSSIGRDKISIFSVALEDRGYGLFFHLVSRPRTVTVWRVDSDGVYAEDAYVCGKTINET